MVFDIFDLIIQYVINEPIDKTPKIILNTNGNKMDDNIDTPSEDNVAILNDFTKTLFSISFSISERADGDLHFISDSFTECACAP